MRKNMSGGAPSAVQYNRQDSRRLLVRFFGYTRTMLVVFCVQALNMLLFSYYVTPALLAVGTAFTGLSYGALFSLFPAATADYYGIKNLGVNFGYRFHRRYCRMINPQNALARVPYLYAFRRTGGSRGIFDGLRYAIAIRIFFKYVLHT